MRFPILGRRLSKTTLLWKFCKTHKLVTFFGPVQVQGIRRFSDPNSLLETAQEGATIAATRLTNVRDTCGRLNSICAFVLGSKNENNWALSQLSLCTHNSDCLMCNYFSIFVPMFSPTAPHFLDHHYSPSNLAGSRVPQPI